MMKTESHRIHWQQWSAASTAASSSTSTSDEGHQQQQQQQQSSTKRNLLTRSAAIRISEAAKSLDVTQLLQKTMKLQAIPNQNDVLVLVGTLFSHSPPRYCMHIRQQPTQESTPATASKVQFHYIKTLRSNDKPLGIHDTMKKYLEDKQKEIQKSISMSSSIATARIAPKLQWFFIPADPASQIPTYIELDGYSTDTESTSQDDILNNEDEDGWSDDEEDDDENLPKCMLNRRTKHEAPEISPDEATKDIPNNSKCFFKRQDRFRQFQIHKHALEPYFAGPSGYLQLQSPRDPHVWKRVFCMMTEDHLWYLYRVKDDYKNNLPSIPKCGRIALTNATLEVSRSAPVEISTKQADPSRNRSSKKKEFYPPRRVPHSWEMVVRSGITANSTSSSSTRRSFVLRAPNKSVQSCWINALQDRMQQCEDNQLMEHAELIVADESAARQKRLAHLLWSGPGTGIDNDRSVQWTLRVMDYRERCRHIQQRLPAKTPVIVATKSPSSSSLTTTITTPSSSSLLQDAQQEKLDPPTRAMIQEAWQIAKEIFQSALEERRQFMLQSNNKHSLLGLDTHCRHIEYVLTGKMRSHGSMEPNSFGDDEPSSIVLDKNRDSPPIDLFDKLLVEIKTTLVKAH